MLLIESVKCRKTERDYVELSHYEGPPVGEWTGANMACNPTCRMEAVHGERFTLPDGTTRCIGMTEEVQKVLGIPMRAFRDMSEQIARQQESIQSLLAGSHTHKTLLRAFFLELRTLGFWERIRFAFGWDPETTLRDRVKSWLPFKENE